MRLSQNCDGCEPDFSGVPVLSADDNHLRNVDGRRRISPARSALLIRQGLILASVLGISAMCSAARAAVGSSEEHLPLREATLRLKARIENDVGREVADELLGRLSSAQNAMFVSRSLVCNRSQVLLPLSTSMDALVSRLVPTAWRFGKVRAHEACDAARQVRQHADPIAQQATEAMGKTLASAASKAAARLLPIEEQRSKLSATFTAGTVLAFAKAKPFCGVALAKASQFKATIGPFTAGTALAFAKAKPFCGVVFAKASQFKATIGPSLSPVSSSGSFNIVGVVLSSSLILLSLTILGGVVESGSPATSDLSGVGVFAHSTRIMDAAAPRPMSLGVADKSASYLRMFLVGTVIGVAVVVTWNTPASVRATLQAWWSSLTEEHAFAASRSMNVSRSVPVSPSLRFRGSVGSGGSVCSSDIPNTPRRRWKRVSLHGNETIPAAEYNAEAAARIAQAAWKSFEYSESAEAVNEPEDGLGVSLEVGFGSSRQPWATPSTKQREPQVPQFRGPSTSSSHPGHSVSRRQTHPTSSIPRRPTPPRICSARGRTPPRLSAMEEAAAQESVNDLKWGKLQYPLRGGQPNEERESLDPACSTAPTACQDPCDDPSLQHSASAPRLSNDMLRMHAASAPTAIARKAIRGKKNRWDRRSSSATNSSASTARSESVESVESVRSRTSSRSRSVLDYSFVEDPSGRADDLLCAASSRFHRSEQQSSVTHTQFVDDNAIRQDSKEPSVSVRDRGPVTPRQGHKL